jgi:DNA-binding CsgD family transcriptional regulator
LLLRCTVDKPEIRRTRPEEAAAVWRELCQGGWAIVDRIDDGCGHRIVLARAVLQATPRPWHLLSPRERTVVQWAATGRTNPEIAAKLGVSVPTVAGYLRAARKKLGWISRIDLIKEWTALSAPVPM